MRKPKLFVRVGSRTFRVTEHPGYLKADLNGYFGWTSVWADTQVNLERRIKQVRSGAQ